MKLKNNQIFIGCLSATVCEIIFGFSYIFTKHITNDISEMALLGWRFAVALLGLGVFFVLGLVKLSLKGKNLKPLWLIALFSPVLYFIGETVGISYTTASESGIFLAIIPVGALIASTIMLRKRPTNLQLIGIFFTILGVLITLLAVGLSASFSFIGYSFLILAAASYAFYSVYVAKAEEFTSAEITFAMIASGALVFVSWAVWEALVNSNFTNLMLLPFTNTHFLSAILFQGLGCSLIAFFLANVAIARIGVNRTASFIGVSTVVSILAGTLFLDESFTIYQLVGGIIILLGVYLANAQQKTKA
jgi:drug/metabolite transporter (DMT)-like permease